MKLCSTCKERFEDELRFCTFDGTPLHPLSGYAADSSSSPVFRTHEPVRLHSSRSGVKLSRARGRPRLLIMSTVVAVLGIGAAAYIMTRGDAKPIRPVAATSAGAGATSTPAQADVPAADPKKPGSLAELTRDDLIALLPANLLRRFQTGQPGKGGPDEIRVIAVDDGEVVVLAGTGRIEGPNNRPAARILVLKFDGYQFTDGTRELLPTSYAGGIVQGTESLARFDEGHSLALVERATTRPVIEECDSCEHAYQRVVLSWKDNRYVESSRAWENDSYSVFYSVAEALERRRVDVRSRSVIDPSLDAVIVQGFARQEKRGWTVIVHGDPDASDQAEYELGNGDDNLIVTVARIEGEWKATRISSVGRDIANPFATGQSN